MKLFKTKAKPKESSPPLRGKDLTFAFRDAQGRAYYHNTTQVGQSLEHYGKAMEFTMFMSAGMNATELTQLINLQEEVIEKVVEGKKGNLAILMWVCREMKNRSQLIIHTELLYNFIACYYYREDEPVTEWNETIHNEKVEAFKQIVKEGSAYDFFQLPELKNLTAISSMSREEWTEHWNASQKEMARLQSQIDYLRSELASAPDRKTSKKA